MNHQIANRELSSERRQNVVEIFVDDPNARRTLQVNSLRPLNVAGLIFFAYVRMNS
jgi:hypothetical protein